MPSGEILPRWKPREATLWHRGQTGHQHARKGDKQKGNCGKIAGNCENMRDSEKLPSHEQTGGPSLSTFSGCVPNCHPPVNRPPQCPPQGQSTRTLANTLRPSMQRGTAVHKRTSLQAKNMGSEATEKKIENMGGGDRHTCARALTRTSGLMNLRIHRPAIGLHLQICDPQGPCPCGPAVSCPEECLEVCALQWCCRPPPPQMPRPAAAQARRSVVWGHAGPHFQRSNDLWVHRPVAKGVGCCEARRLHAPCELTDPYRMGIKEQCARGCVPSRRSGCASLCFRVYALFTF